MTVEWFAATILALSHLRFQRAEEVSCGHARIGTARVPKPFCAADEFLFERVRYRNVRLENRRQIDLVELGIETDQAMLVRQGENPGDGLRRLFVLDAQQPMQSRMFDGAGPGTILKPVLGHHFDFSGK